MSDLEPYIQFPTIIMFGCQSLSATRRAPADCPVCKGGIRPGHDTRYCGVCDSLSPRREAQVKAALAGVGRRDKASVDDKRARDLFRAEAGRTLTEAERRRYWNGCRHGVLAECTEITNAAKVGREWLTAIGQEPDWSIDLSKGRERA